MIVIAKFIGLLTAVFIGLKLVDFIDWSWVWVLSPTWIALIIVLLAVVLILRFDCLSDWEDEW